ncbi:GNAT family N-acetyltransferase [Neobacillus sp. PS3-40]|uniref:GNAT family N-acetyltransferase n=1 Tax=Neobacillus sp. PS3-40 TaxID=3070679 RepID=UPI0027E0E549|nr:GNAT family N-acetyltransferase [Neobacillus sp. PS3-40]WML44274.1 GNAT family N-acetyltransferase [Neobacillus sp. PS3-40]
MVILKATLNDLDSLTELFDLYRVFYQQKSDTHGAREFLKERLNNKESVIFIALDENVPVGFVQLYPLFSSVCMVRTWLLNDLYVKETVRGKGFGEGLLNKAIAYAEETGAKGLTLETGEKNKIAQRLYEKIGFKRETSYFYHYSI